MSGRPYSLGKKITGRYVMATVITHRQELVVKVGGRVCKRLAFTIHEQRVAPLVPLPRGRY